MAKYGELFSKQASEYAQYRPSYPKDLFSFLASVANGRERAWDCGTGSGQAALSLAEHFLEVLATDANAEQIANAKAHARVHYSVKPAEQSGFADHSVDLVTVAQALHWFDLEKFYAEIKRVVRPGGVAAFWCYERNWEINPEVDELLRKFTFETVGPFWPPEVQLVWDHYKTIPFPFEEIEHPEFTVRTTWSVEALIGYLASWSATQQYIDHHGTNPLVEMEGELRQAWGSEIKSRELTWQIYMRVGRVR